MKSTISFERGVALRPASRPCASMVLINANQVAGSNGGVRPAKVRSCEVIGEITHAWQTLRTGEAGTDDNDDSWAEMILKSSLNLVKLINIYHWAYFW
jgi:hypothetical protein